MPFFMLMLFAAVALVIIVAGLFLSSTHKTPNPNLTSPQIRGRNRTTVSEYPASPMVRRASRMVARQSLVSQSVRIRPVPVVEISEQRPWLEMWQSLAVGRVFKRRPGEPTPWMGILLVLLSVFLLFMFMMRMIMPNTMMIGALGWSSLQSSSSQQNTPKEPTYAASQALLRISQLDPSQYNSNQEYNLWAYSACSSAAITEIINSYGHHYRVTDILKVESAIGEITPQLGLLEDAGVAYTMSHFNFKTTWGHNLSLDAILNIANHGKPVIVSWPPDRYAGGHIVVVKGGDANTVYLADSSLYNRHSLSRSQFMQWWEGYYAISTPQ